MNRARSHQQNTDIKHNKVAAAVLYSVCKKYELLHTEKWYGHLYETVLDYNKVKLLSVGF